MSNSNFTCSACGTKYTTEKRYTNHLNTGHCAFLCSKCGKQSKSRQGLYQHKKACKEKNTVNKTNNNNIVTSNSHNPTNNMLNNQNNNQNIVMLQPFDVDHYNMKKEDAIGSKRNLIVRLLEEEKYHIAYEELFKHIHGNKELPQHHNIYMDGENLAIFRGYDFENEAPEKSLHRILSRLRFEMGWLVKSCDRLNEKEKEQLLWDIQANWMVINEKKDPNMKRILRNNKKVVMRTMKNNIVKSDTQMIKNVLALKDDPRQGTKGIPTVKTINEWIDNNCTPLDEVHNVSLP